MIRAANLVKEYDAGLVKALRGVSFTAAAGEAVALMGPSGCGKTTPLSILSSLEPPSSGEVFIDGRPLESYKPFAAFQYVSGQNAFGAGTGDPAMITAIPVEQFLKSYVILTPTGYSQDYVQIVRTSNEPVLVDGAAVPDSEYYAIGGYTVADHLVGGGSHVLTSTGAFGIVGVGYTNVTSYGYPGGFALKDLTP